MVVMKTEMRIF